MDDIEAAGELMAHGAGLVDFVFEDGCFLCDRFRRFRIRLGCFRVIVACASEHLPNFVFKGSGDIE